MVVERTGSPAQQWGTWCWSKGRRWREASNGLAPVEEATAACLAWPSSEAPCSGSGPDTPLDQSLSPLPSQASSTDGLLLRLTWAFGCSACLRDLLFSILYSWALAFFRRLATLLSVMGSLSAWASTELMEEVECFTRPTEEAGRPKDSSFSTEGAARPSSGPPRPFLDSLVLIAAAESAGTTAGTLAAGALAVDFFRPAGFLAEEERAASSCTIPLPLAMRVKGNKAELLWRTEAFFRLSFLDSRLFSFSLSRSLLFSFSTLFSLSLSLAGSSGALSLFLPLSVWGLGVYQGKRGAGPLDVKGSEEMLACFLGLWLFSLSSPGWAREWEEKAKGAFKAPVVRDPTEREEETEEG